MYNWSLQREGEVSEKKHSQKITKSLKKTKQNKTTNSQVQEAQQT